MNSSKNPLPFFIFLIISASIIIIDQVSKYFALTLNGIVLIPGVLTWTYVLNQGAAFGMFQGMQFVLGIVNLIISLVIGIVLFKHKFDRGVFISLSFIAGGALGNAIDRFFRIGVIDFLNLGWWPVFNVADSFIVVGVCMLLYVEIRNSIVSKST